MISQYIVNGLLTGGLYACLAVGFSLVWGVLNVVNMLHGSLVVLGAYFCLYGVQQLGLPLYTVAPVACAILFVFAIFFVVFREGGPYLVNELDLGEFVSTARWAPTAHQPPDSPSGVAVADHPSSSSRKWVKTCTTCPR